MQSKERGLIDEVESWRVRLREEQENILSNLRWLQVYRKALHVAWAQGECIKPFIVSPYFFNIVWLRRFDITGLPAAVAVRN